MLLKFSAQASVSSPSTNFPRNVIDRVIVSNRVGCTHQDIDRVDTNRFEVNFELKPLQSDTQLTDTVKLFFYTNRSKPIVVAAGQVPIRKLARLMEGKKVKPVSFRCNFSPVTVSVEFFPPSQPVKVSLPAMVPSALRETDLAKHLFAMTSEKVACLLQQNLQIDPKCGASMFLNLLTCHNMTEQATTHMHYQMDVAPTKTDGELFFRSGLTMTALAEALHATCHEVDEALSMPQDSERFTSFAAMACQAFQRSAHACPYEFDKVLGPELNSAGLVQEVNSESFTLPLREPFAPGASYLCMDDCEGQSTFILHLFHSFKFLYEQYNGSKEEGMRVAMPQTMFDMSAQDQGKLWDLAMKLGKMASDQTMRCDLIVISAGGAALGDGKDELGGHCTAVMVNASNSDKPHDILMEGTNAIDWEQSHETITVNQLMTSKTLTIAGVANFLTQQISKMSGPMEKFNQRLMAHIDVTNEEQFYKTAFCQNGTLLASSVAKQLCYGVNMKNISNYELKVLMPLSPDLLKGETQMDGAVDFLAKHALARQAEIHPPHVSLGTLNAITGRWHKATMFRKPDVMAGKKFKVCLAMKSYAEPDKRAEAAVSLSKTVDQWNARYSGLGHMSVYTAFDTVFTRLCFWTDDLHALEARMNELVNRQQ